MSQSRKNVWDTFARNFGTEKTCEINQQPLFLDLDMHL